MIKTLTSWRAVLVLCIVLYHAGVQCMQAPTMMGVSFFFMSSGMLLAMNHSRVEAGWRRWMAWTAERACRFYPIHWLALALTLLGLWMVGQLAVDWTLIPNALLLQPWFPAREVILSYNKPSWFLGALLFCYACYPWLSRHYATLRLRWQVLLIVAVMATLVVVLPHLSTPARYFTYFLPLVRLCDFALGITLARVTRLITTSRFKTSNLKSTIIELAALLLVLELLFIDEMTTLLLPWEEYVLWWIPVALLLLTCAVLNGREGYVGRLMSWRPLVWLGTLSLEIYMLHGVAEAIYCRLVAPVAGHWGWMIYDQHTWLALPILVLLAWAVHRLLWGRSRAWGKALASAIGDENHPPRQ